MLERKLIVGRYLELNTPQPGFVGPAINGFREVTRQVWHIDESEWESSPVAPNNVMPGFNPTLGQSIQIGFQRAGQHIKSQFERQRTSVTRLGQVGKDHRNFIWLEWLPGLVSEVRPNGIDVLTGPMSGCWITSYLRGGVHYVGHVGTDMERNHPNSIAARGAWNTFAAGVPIAAYSGFNPFNDRWDGAVPTPQPGEANRKTFALVTAEGHFYTIITYPQINRPTRIRIAGIQRKYNSLPGRGQIA
jgi:hypothetical protein